MARWSFRSNRLRRSEAANSRIVCLESERRPPDAAVETQMRRSLADVNTIPALYYGMVDIDATPVFQVRLMTSRPESAQEFVAHMRAVTGGGETTEAEEPAKNPPYAHFDPVRVPLFHSLSDRSLEQLPDALMYGNEDLTVKRLEALHKAVAVLRSADSVWSVGNASLATALPSHPPALNRTKVASEASPLPDHIRTNITPAALQLADCTLYFFPDRLFAWRSGRLRQSATEI